MQPYTGRFDVCFLVFVVRTNLGLRPFGVSFLYAGWDKHFGFQLYHRCAACEAYYFCSSLDVLFGRVLFGRVLWDWLGCGSLILACEIGRAHV